MVLYENLILELKRRGITQAELAEQIGISETTFSRKMSGRQDFWLSEARAIADRLSPCKMDELFEKK